MKTYIYDDPELGRISYVDRKRYLWVLSVLFPLIPLVGMGLMHWTGHEWTLWMPLAFVYLGIPLLDHLFPNDASNPPEQVVPQSNPTIGYEDAAEIRVLEFLTRDDVVSALCRGDTFTRQAAASILKR